jgi:hypothetical protein
MKWYFLGLLLLLGDAFAPPLAGQPVAPEARRRIEQYKIAFLTRALDLSPDQAQRFWPVYNEFNRQRDSLRREIARLRHGAEPETMKASDIRQKLDTYYQLEDQLHRLRQRYRRRLLDQAVLTPRQMLRLEQALADFRRRLLERLSERQDAR